jgi:hypothetical protein
MDFLPNSHLVYGQSNLKQSNEMFEPLNTSSPVPSNLEMILTDEIITLGTDIDVLKNASESGDFDVVYNKTIEIISGPSWGNISADLLYRQAFDPLNNFVTTLGSLNTLSKNTTSHTKFINETIIKEGNKLTTEYGKVLDALAVPMYDIPKIVTNMIVPAIIIVVIVVSIPKLRRKYKIRY